MREEMTATRTDLTGHEMLWKALAALAIGALLGALVAVPYDRWLGFSTPLCTVLQSLVATASMTSLAANQTRLTLETRGLPRQVPEPVPSRCEVEGRARMGHWMTEIQRHLGNLKRVLDVLIGRASISCSS
jgi:hypothetical protein